jgi:23S rRNA pseudouridine1911/1915/1917 synthase
MAVIVYASPMESSIWKIPPEDEGDRLDLYLAERMPERSRSAVQKLIKDGRVTINKGAATVHRFLKDGDVIEWDGQEVQATRSASTHNPLTDADTHSLQTPTETSAPQLEDFIVEETPGWIVIDKPAGLLVHPDAKTANGTLVDALLAYDPAVAKVGEDPQRPGIVHRLDRDVSGLMIVARTQAAYDELKRQFAGREIHKRYLAMCYGSLPEEEGDIKFRIARSKTQPRMAARPSHEEEGKAAWTHYRVKERFKGATLVELEILSGRTHQIRAHLHAMQCPIMGDPLYTIRNTERNVKAPRLMLQSIAFEFTNPATGERKSFELAPSPEFENLAEEFRNS